MSQDNLGIAEQVQANVPAAAVETPIEKTFTASQVEEIKRHTAARVSEKARKDATEAYQAQQAQLAQNQSGIPQSNLSLQEIERMVDTAAERKIEKIRQQHDENIMRARADTLISQVQAKIARGKDLAKEDGIEDFEQTLSRLPYANMPNVIEAANEFENTDRILYELAKNQREAQAIQELFRFNPVEARNDLQKLSESIKQQDKAGKAKVPNEPLKQIRPSPVNKPADNGSLSIADHMARRLSRRRV